MHPGIRRALVVEDDDALRTALARLLSKAGIELLEARTAERARELLLQQSPNLLIVDVRLPDATAFELIEIARELAPAPVIVAMSGKASPDEAFRLAKSGVRTYLPKPFSLKELRSALDSAFSEPPVLDPLIRAAVGRIPLRKLQSEVRSIMVSEALARAEGNRSAAARLLQVTRQAIQQIIRSDSDEGAVEPAAREGSPD